MRTRSMSRRRTSLTSNHQSPATQMAHLATSSRPLASTSSRQPREAGTTWTWTSQTMRRGSSR
jgi:hypothetical protein